MTDILPDGATTQRKPVDVWKGICAFGCVTTVETVNKLTKLEKAILGSKLMDAHNEIFHGVKTSFEYDKKDIRKLIKYIEESEKEILCQQH